jgi:hypothetical protein
VINHNADRRLVNRFKQSGFPNIRAMLEGHEVEAPKQNGKETCMTWACKGQCQAGCKRKAMHIRYSTATINAYHAMMDTCGVANPQE